MKEAALKAEVTGTVWKVVVSEGDVVVALQELVLVESMKMEIPLVAPQAGTVARLLVAEGDVVTEGQELVRLRLG